jgi:succinyl-CoA synthetase beta subunit
MNIHEYQGKAVLAQFGVPVAQGLPAFTVDEAVAAATKLGGQVWAVKSQIHAGGRGKGKFKEAKAGDKGGVRIAKSVDEVKEFASQMLGSTLVTIQTGPKGKQVNRIYVEQGSAIAKEFYLSMLVDRESSRVAIVASTEGGMDIEKVAHDTPEKITTIKIDPVANICPHHVRRLSKALGLNADQTKQMSPLLTNLYRAFVEKDMSLLEINPLIINKDGKLVCLDAKIGFDDNALFRHADIAMASMDIIKLYGMSPANFLDVGGSATTERVTAAFKIITSDPNVKGILVNIFGGIMKCDVIAEGVVTAVKEVGLRVPLVVRLEGTNVEKGKEIIAKSNLNVTSADDLDDAAQKIVKAVKGG